MCLLCLCLDSGQPEPRTMAVWLWARAVILSTQLSLARDPTTVPVCRTPNLSLCQGLSELQASSSSSTAAFGDLHWVSPLQKQE